MNQRTLLIMMAGVFLMNPNIGYGQEETSRSSEAVTDSQGVGEGPAADANLDKVVSSASESPQDADEGTAGEEIHAEDNAKQEHADAPQDASESPSHANKEQTEAGTSNEETLAEETPSLAIPILTTVAGVSAASTGLAVIAMGLRPLMQFYQAQSALETEEERALNDPDGALQNAVVFQSIAYERNKEWKMNGLPMVVGGALLSFGGTVLIGAGTVGLAWHFAGESE